MIKKLIGWYSIFPGCSVIFLRTFILKTTAQEEGSVNMGINLMSEFLMACFRIVSDIKILLKHNGVISSLILNTTNG